MTAFTSKFCFKRKKNSRTSLTQFRTDINSAFIQSAFEKSQKFLPETAVHDFCTEAQVQGLLPRASRDLVDFLCKNAKRAFLTLLLCIDEPTKLFKAAQSFQQCRLTDECLPIQGREMQCENKSVSRPQSQSNSKCVHDHASDVFRDWDDLKFAAFCEYQWRFMSPIFKNSEFKQILNSLSVLPFTWVNEYPRDGHFSTVREARLHAAHHESQQSTEEIHVAIKQLKNLNGEPGYDVQRAWELEAQALDKISMIHDNHLINRIAAFKRGQDYFILFEWASGGNLRDFWKENRTIHEKLDGNHIICLLKQLRGLARALDRLHGTTQRSMSAVPTGSSIGSSSVGGMRMDDASITAKNHVAIPIKVNGDENYEELTSDEHWRHGDLKPDNILKFDGEHSDLFGILKIADLGLAKQHKNATSFRDSPTNTTHTTWHYEAPEVATKSHQPRSRRYDIWSIGCIILESITWLLYGYDVLNKFLEMDSNPQSSRDSLYFSTFNNSEGQLTAKISHTSKLWMEHILLMDPECNKPMATAIGDVLKLVRDKLLVVELPDRNMGSEGTAQCRADSSTLSKSLNKIWETALVNPSYGFSGANRRGVKAPTPQISFGGQLAPGHHQPHGPAASQHLNTYKHISLNDNWELLDDKAFALRLLNCPEIRDLSISTHRVPVLCDCCRRLDFVGVNFLFEKTLTDLRMRSQDCEFCALLLNACTPERMPFGEPDPIKLRSLRSGLAIDGALTRVLSICKNHANDPSSNGHPEDIQLGLPVLPRIDSPAYYTILSRWLEDCEKHTKCCPDNLTPVPSRLPTRLINVRRKGSTEVLLSDTSRWSTSRAEGVRYIALSHPWGDAKYHTHFSTTTKNIDDRLEKGIIYDELPATFKDAVKVTRELGIHYLWIDSLCIIQGDDGDFEDEAKHMEAVFSSAYCVIAASRASGTSAGFLKQRPDRKFVEFQDSLKNPFVVCEAIDDFQHDVIDGALNKRGWVLQERALARRTIYFAEKQTYWECGDGIRCETLTKMTNNKAAFLGDPNFPQAATTQTKGAQIRLYESLYKQYSTLEFSKAYDRPIAIAGLEQRLIRAFGKQGGYGIFERYFGRTLLWQRDLKMGDEPMKAIEFPPQQQYRVPTWSWMRYEGGITFMDLPFSGVQWEDDSQIRSPWAANNASSSHWHTGDSEGRIHLTARVRDFDLGLAEKEIAFDKVITPRDRAMKCVVIGSQKSEAAPDVKTRKHYVLIVAPMHGDAETYERLGVGSLCGSWIALDVGGLKVHIS